MTRRAGSAAPARDGEERCRTAPPAPRSARTAARADASGPCRRRPRRVERRALRSTRGRSRDPLASKCRAVPSQYDGGCRRDAPTSGSTRRCEHARAAASDARPDRDGRPILAASQRQLDRGDRRRSSRPTGDAVPTRLPRAEQMRRAGAARGGRRGGRGRRPAARHRASTAKTVSPRCPNAGSRFGDRRTGRPPGVTTPRPMTARASGSSTARRGGSGRRRAIGARRSVGRPKGADSDGQAFGARRAARRFVKRRLAYESPFRYTGRKAPYVPPPHANQKESIISNKIFVGNLSFDTTQEELSDAVVASRKSRTRPHRYRIARPDVLAGSRLRRVRRPDTEAADAIRKFDGYDLEGRRLRVNSAEDRPQRPAGGGGGGYRPSPSPPRPVVRGAAEHVSRPAIRSRARWAAAERAVRNKNKGSRRGLRARKRSLGGY